MQITGLTEETRTILKRMSYHEHNQATDIVRMDHNITSGSGQLGPKMMTYIY